MATGSLALKDIENEGEDPVTLFMRAKLYEKDKNLDSAILEYKKCLYLDPNFVNAAYGKAACENLLGRFEEAIVTYESAFKRDVSEADRDKPILISSPSPPRRVDYTPKLFSKDSAFHSIKVELIDVEEKPFDEIDTKSK